MGEEKMSVLAGLRPERVFYYFEELCRIPHGSGNTKEVSDYLVQFARDHELSWYQDASNNVIIRRPASKGCELAPTVILQGHCDMVCEKKPGSSHDFTRTALSFTSTAMRFMPGTRRLAETTELPLPICWLCWNRMICSFRPSRH